MYGFGDSEIPDIESIKLLEQYLIEYIQNISILAFKRSKRRGYNEIKLKDLLYVIKNDKKKFYRVPSLLSFYEILKKTKRLDPTHAPRYDDSETVVTWDIVKKLNNTVMPNGQLSLNKTTEPTNPSK